MKKVKGLILFLVIFSLGFGVPLSAHAQKGMGQGKGMTNYDPKTEITTAATVEEVIQAAGKRGCTGTHLIVKTDTGTIEVHAGLTKYLASQEFSFAKGDLIEVTGSKVKFQGTDVLLAREIKKDGKTLALRNAQGVPNWAGSGCW